MTVLAVSQSRPVARKRHDCNDCGGPIESGTTYVRSFVTDDGEAWTWKEHEACRSDADHMIALNWFDPADEWPGQEGFVEMQSELSRTTGDET